MQDKITGLTDSEVAKLKSEGKINRSKTDIGKTIPQIIFTNLVTPFNILNIILAICLIAVGSYRNTLFMGVILANLLIGTIQELRVKRTLDKLKLLNATYSHVMRNGTESKIPADELVEGDIIILRAGDEIPADAVTLDGAGAANESLLTGESDAVHKQAGDELLSGSYITEGRIVARLTRVGDESYAARVTAQAKTVKRPVSQLVRETNKIIRVISIMLVPVGALLLIKQIFLSGVPVKTAITSSVAAMIGMIPEGLILLISAAMMVGIIRLARRQAIVQELSGIEPLAHADVLCLDKTGTITTSNMKLDRVVAMDGNEDALRGDIAKFLSAFEAATTTMAAIARDIKPTDDKADIILPFSSTRKLSAATFGGETLILGAPTFVMKNGLPDNVKKVVEAAAREGKRVMAFAKAKGVISKDTLPENPVVTGIVMIEDEIRPHAAETLSYFAAQDVNIKVISGDDPVTVSRIAENVGLKGEYIDVSTLKDEEIEDASEKYTVFGRVTPARKMALVNALKKRGHSVAMTGDGVNDIPALKAADCSIAMAGGADATRHAAQITLANADFSVLPDIVNEGRQVINNITRSATLFITKTFYSCALAVIMIFLPGRYPFQPIQLSLISTLTIGIPSFLLTFQKSFQRPKGHFLRNVFLKALPGALATMVCVCVSMALSEFTIDGFDFSAAMCSTMATGCAATMGIATLIRVCYPLNLLRTGIIVLMAAAVYGAVNIFPDLFFFETFRSVDFAAYGIICAAGLVIMTVSALITGRIARKQ